MSILVNKQTRVLTQGITGATGQFHTKACKEYGTQMVAGVTPGKGGTAFEGIPIFDTVERAVRETGANASVIYVPPPFAADAILEAADAGYSFDYLYYRRRAGARYGEGEAISRRSKLATARPQLSGHDYARRMQDRHYAGTHSQSGNDRRGFAQWHVDV